MLVTWVLALWSFIELYILFCGLFCMCIIFHSLKKSLKKPFSLERKQIWQNVNNCYNEVKNIWVRCYSFNFLHLQKCTWAFLKVGGKTLFWPNFSCGYYLISSLSLWQNSLKVSLFSRSPVPLLQCSLNILLLGFCFHYSSETDLSTSPMTSTSTLLNPMIVSQFLSLFTICSILHCWSLSSLKHFLASRTIAWFFSYYSRYFCHSPFLVLFIFLDL